MKQAIAIIIVTVLSLVSASKYAAQTFRNDFPAITDQSLTTLTMIEKANDSKEQLSIPLMLSYQGKLTDNLGNPVRDSTYSVTFRLFTVPSGGSAYWTENQAVQTTSGLFSCLLGSVTSIPYIPSDGNCYLEMQVNPNPAMAPRIRIVSAAYSYLSRKADSANYAASAPLTRPITPPVYSTEIRDTTIITDKIKDGAVTMPKLNQAGATAGQVIKWTGSAWAPRPDSFGGPPTGSAGGDLTGTYPNPTITVGAVNSAKILDGSIRGVDITKPCTLSAAAANILVVSNTGGVIGSPAIYSSAVNGPGLLVKSGLQAGVFVDSTGVNSSGLYVRKTTRAGVEVDSATSYGFWLRQYAGSEGIRLRKTGSNGINIDTAGLDGIRVFRAGDDGVYIDSAADNGVDIRRAVNDGITITRAEDGLNIYRISDRAVSVDSARVGLDVAYGADGGVWITNTGATATAAVYGNSDPRRGGFFRNNNNDYHALIAWNNTGTGATVKGLYVQGNGYATGGWSTLLADGKAGFSLISSDMDIVARGSSSLNAGQSIVTFEKTTQETFSNDIPLTVIITPTSECNGIFVVHKSSSGFTARELMNGKSNATFDWIAIGRMRGYEKRPEIRPLTSEDIRRTDAERRVMEQKTEKSESAFPKE